MSSRQFSDRVLLGRHPRVALVAVGLSTVLAGTAWLATGASAASDPSAASVSSVTPVAPQRLIEGVPLTVHFDGSGANVRLALSAAAGERVIVDRTDATVPSALSLEDSTGAQAAERITAWDQPYVEFLPVKTAGSYVLVVRPGDLGEPSAGWTGSVTLTLVTARDIRIRAGRTETVRWTAGQNIVVDVPVTPGSRVTVDATRGSWNTLPSVVVELDDCAGLSYGLIGYLQTGTPSFVESVDLPTPATCRVVLDPGELSAGWMTVRVASVSDVQQRLTFRKASTVRIGQPGVNARLTVALPATQTLRWALGGGSITSGRLTLRAPDGVYGSAAFDATTRSGSFDLFGAALPAGSYTLVLDPAGNVSGPVQVTLK
jgi:hypothetical protein